MSKPTSIDRTVKSQSAIVLHPVVPIRRDKDSKDNSDIRESDAIRTPTAALSRGRWG